jgi:hypothetical protein
MASYISSSRGFILEGGWVWLRLQVWAVEVEGAPCFSHILVECFQLLGHGFSENVQPRAIPVLFPVGIRRQVSFMVVHYILVFPNV